MSSFKETYTDEVEGLFSRLRPKNLRAKADAVTQEGELVPLVPFSFNGADVFDSTDTMDMLIYVPDEMVSVVKARVVLAFREFFAPATTVASGGGSTSGASSASTSGSGSAHSHEVLRYVNDIPGATTNRNYQGRDSGGSVYQVTLSTEGPGQSVYTYGAEASHTHGMSHTHTTPNHSHALSYGIYKETFPVSHSVELRLYEWSGTAWTLLHTVTGLTDDVEDVDLGSYIDAPGKYRVSLKSAAGQPQGGRLGCDAAGHVVGAIQPR